MWLKILLLVEERLVEVLSPDKRSVPESPQRCPVRSRKPGKPSQQVAQLAPESRATFRRELIGLPVKVGQLFTESGSGFRG